ncbi:hypothetical protein [Bifidobacterium aquikefiricola]|uniref:DUF465 domain-containing protein n=1 Tax=Bifidobacterium aquikefiricola TaxID=3059038 RepID=A0AB39U4C5_9BIFI
MTAVRPSAHRIGPPVMLDDATIVRRREALEHEYGTLHDLIVKRNGIGLNPQERIALRKLEALDYLEGE